MPTPTFAEDMVTKLEGLLRDNLGARSVTFPDGTSVTYEDLTAQYEHWKAAVLREQKKRPRILTPYMTGGG